MKHLLMAISTILILSGCASTRHAVPGYLIGKAAVTGMPDIRSYAYKPNPLFVQKSLVDSFSKEDKLVYANSLGLMTYPSLVISGGVSNSAYGAGFLKGWSKQGSRPAFKVVTGASSGALIAIGAFLGKDYDDQLEDIFTNVSTKDVMRKRNILTILFSDSVMTSDPLAKKIERMVDERLLAKVCEEHRKGRRLYVGTTDMDAQDFVLWDMGALACKGGPDSVKMFRKILLASCSFPLVVSPVKIQVKYGGRHYDEMHVDGAITKGLFYIGQLTENMEEAARISGVDLAKFKSRIYVLCCSYMVPHPKEIKDNLTAITERAIDTYGQTSIIGDVYKLYAFSKKKGWDFNLAYIPSDFETHQTEMLDRKEMQRLFKRGYEDAVEGYKWHKAPPDLE